VEADLALALELQEADVEERLRQRRALLERRANATGLVLGGLPFDLAPHVGDEEEGARATSVAHRSDRSSQDCKM
jgi:hypothetical protein